MNSPTRRIEITHRPTVIGLLRSFVMLIFTWLGLSIVFTISVLATRRVVDNPIALGALVGILGVFVAMFLCGEFVGKQLKKEAAAGYTTSPFTQIHLPEVDPRSQLIIREAGEPRLSRGQRRRVLATLRGSKGA